MPPTAAPALTTIAPGVKQVTVGERAMSQVYLLDHPDGPVAFDAGVRGTGQAVLDAAGAPLSRVVLSHSHIDHRGGANELGAPVFCHPDEVADVKGDAGASYTDFGLIRNPVVREAMPKLLALWDGGPVDVAGTVAAGDDVAGFEVIHLPGHAPGQIALFRHGDRLLLAADSIYTIDMEAGRPGAPRVPHPATSWDTEMARASIRRLIGLEPASVFTGHAGHFDTDVARQLEAAASFSYA
ncbi:MAG TPA: MBL fold metallo-hydrolase [Thermoleophilaceae bacterium]